MMQEKLNYAGKLLNCATTGNGNAVIMLHGYLETHQVFESIVPAFERTYKLILPDLPGHGQSSFTHEKLSMREMADAVIFLMNHYGIETAALLGHSMGGYVALEIAAQYPDRVAGLCLFHSSPFADTDEKKTAREREKEIVRSGHKELIYKNHFPKTFANARIEQFQSQIQQLTQWSAGMPDEGIIGVLTAMQNRNDYSTWLTGYQKPFLYILGDSDNFIPQSILEKIQFPKTGNFVVLPDTGHMGFWEAPNEAIAALNGFLNRCF